MSKLAWDLVQKMFTLIIGVTHYFHDKHKLVHLRYRVPWRARDRISREKKIIKKKKTFCDNYRVSSK